MLCFDIKMSDLNGEKMTPGDRCGFFVLRKKRCCRMLVKPGKKYCGEHAHLEQEQLPSQDSSATKPRIPCPNDPKHSCDASRLENHLLKCPSRPEPLPLYVSAGINGTIDQTQSPLSIRHVSDEVLLDLISRVNMAHQKFLANLVKEEILKHNLIEEEMVKNASFYGPEVLKHLVQNSSLLGHLQKSNILRENTTFIEFGSGRGQLTYWIVKSTQTLENCRYFLIDRDSHRHKFDNKLKNEGPEVTANVERIRADIQNLVLEKFPGVTLDTNNVVAVSKHLCGVATDFSLNCIKSFSEDCQSNCQRTKSILIALCCHHRCVWSSYTGKDFFLDNGFSPVDFELICGLTSWWTCGTGKPRASKDKVEEPQIRKVEGQEKVIYRYDKLDLDRVKREEIGQRCKQLIDFGRLMFVKEKLGMDDSRLLFYVDKKYTLENVALFCKKNSFQMNSE